MTKRAYITFNSGKETGNIFYLLGQAKEILDLEEFTELYSKVTEQCESYEEALQVIRGKIALIDLDGIY